MSGAPPRARRMVSLGKVTAPKPVNLPSQKKENNGNDPAVNLVPKGSGTWGESLASAGSTQSSHLDTSLDAPKLPPRAIPAAPTAAWGGAGLPEERKRALELASREEFPTLAATEYGADRQRSRPPSEMRQAAWDDDERNFAGFADDREGPGFKGERWGEHGSYSDKDRPLYGDNNDRSYGPPDRDRYGPGPDWDRYDRSRPPPPDWERYGGGDERYHGHREGQGYNDHDRYGRHAPPDDRYGPMPPRGYGAPPPREYGYNDEDYYGPSRRYHDGPSSRGESDYERDQRRPYADGSGPYRGPPRPDRFPPRDHDYNWHGPDYFPRAPPPPPPPRRKEQTPEPSSSMASTPPKHANGVPLERSMSMQSGSTMLSDSTAASSRRATHGSSMPRSDWGSVAGEMQVAADSTLEEGKLAPIVQGEVLATSIRGEKDLYEQPKHDEPRKEVSPMQGRPVQPAAEVHEKSMSHMQPLGAPPRKAVGKLGQAVTQVKQQSLPIETPDTVNPIQLERGDGQGTSLSPTSQQQTTPTKILKREAPLTQQPSAAAGSMPANPEQQKQQQQQQQQHSQGVIKPPPPPPPRLQQPPAPVVAAESAARAAQLNLGGGATAQQQGRAGGWGPPQKQGRGQQQGGLPFHTGHATANGGGRQQGQKVAPGVGQGSKQSDEEVQLDAGISLPTQDSLMHHIASPERQQMLHVMPAPVLGQQQRQGPDMNGIARNMLPATQPRLPVSVTAQFGPSPGQQQQPQQQLQALPQHLMQLSFAGLAGRNGAPVPYAAIPGTGALNANQQQAQQTQRVLYAPGGFMLPAQHVQHAPPSSMSSQMLQVGRQGLPISQQQLLGLQQPPQSALASAGPNSSMPQPLMTFGSAPQEVHASTPAPPAPAVQAVQPVLQFGNVMLPDTIEGSVEDIAPDVRSAGFTQQQEYTAEQQHAFMKAKAAEKVRLLHEQEARRKQEEERRMKHRSTGRPQQHVSQKGVPQQLPDSAPPPPPRRPGSANARPTKDRGRGKPDIIAQQQQQHQQQQHSEGEQRQAELFAGRGQAASGRGGRGGRGRGRGRGETKPASAGDFPAGSSEPQLLPGGNATVVEVRKPHSKQQQQQKGKTEKAGNGTVPSLPPGLTPGSNKGQAGCSSGAATATVVVVEGQRFGGGKKGSGKASAAPRRGDSQQAEVGNSGELSDQAPAGRSGVRGGRSRGMGNGRGGKTVADSPLPPSSVASDAGDSSKQPSIANTRGRGRGRGVFGRRVAVKPAANQGAAKLVETA